MKYIVITDTFRRQLKRMKRYLSETDVVYDVKRFIQKGLSKGETFLETHTSQTVRMTVVKLRLTVHQVDFRYLMGIINERDYLPIVIDLKKGRYGENLSFKADKQTTKKIETAVTDVISDYLRHTEENPALTAYAVEE